MVENAPDKDVSNSAVLSGLRRLVFANLIGLAVIAVVLSLPWAGVAYCVFVGSSACPAILSPQMAQLPRTERPGDDTAQAPRATGSANRLPAAPAGPLPAQTAGNRPTANPRYVALVIGNSDYRSPNTPLKNPKNDAEAIARTLQQLNYTLVGGKPHFDLGYDGMRSLLIEFKRATANARIGFIYYAGHGIQIDDNEPIYLVPVDAKLQRKDELEIEAVPLSFVTKSLPRDVLADGTEQIGIVVLDACRTSNYPLQGLAAAKRGTGQRGLKAVKAPKRSYIAFSASSGEPASDGEGENSPYAKSLLKRMTDRDAPSVKTVFDRVDRDFEENNENQTPVKDDKLADRNVRLAAAQAPPPVGTKKPDCDVCPEIVVLPKGTFLMGAPKTEAGSDDDERPQHQVTVESFAIGTKEVTFREWDACVADGGCTNKADDRGWGRGDRPVINVNWDDAQQYVRWLSARTYNNYRLPTEAEWEYAARAGTKTAYPWGDKASRDHANYGKDEGFGGFAQGRDKWADQTAPVGQFPANKYGLYDMHGNVFEWTEDCWNYSYKGAPRDGRAWTAGDCSLRVLRGGSWSNTPQDLRSAVRIRVISTVWLSGLGFRVARTL